MVIPAGNVKSQAFLFIVLPICNPETEMLRVKIDINIRSNINKAYTFQPTPEMADFSPQSTHFELYEVVASSLS